MERSAELEGLVALWFDAASRGDPSLVDQLVSPRAETRLIGSDPTEWLVGGDRVREFLRGEVTGAAGAATFAPTDVVAFRDGDAGWATANLTITLADGRHVRPRWSAVWHREDGRWRFVQIHASIGIPNADVGWEY